MFTRATNFAANFAAKKSQRVVSCDPKVSYFLPSVHTHFCFAANFAVSGVRSRKCRRLQPLPA